jgi:hypothetical protein
VLASLLPAQATTLKIQSNFVVVSALVKDARGEIVYGFEAKDLLVEDNGVEQSVRLDSKRLLSRARSASFADFSRHLKPHFVKCFCVNFIPQVARWLPSFYPRPLANCGEFP